MADAPPPKRPAREIILARRRIFIASAVALAVGCDKPRPDVCLKIYVAPPPDASTRSAPSVEPQACLNIVEPSPPPPAPTTAPSVAPTAAPTATAPAPTASAPAPQPPPAPTKPPRPRICLLMLDVDDSD